MSYNQRQTIYIGQPVTENQYNNIVVVGYTDLKEYENIMVVSSFGQNDLDRYGEQVNKIKRIYSDYPIANVHEKCAVFLKKPSIQNKKGYYDAQYTITSTIERFNRKTAFDIIENV